MEWGKGICIVGGIRVVAKAAESTGSGYFRRFPSSAHMHNMYGPMTIRLCRRGVGGGGVPATMCAVIPVYQDRISPTILK